MAFQPLSSQASLFIRFRLAAFGLGAGVPHPLSNFRMAQTFADFTWLGLALPYFTLVAVPEAVLVAHGLSALVKSG